MGQEIVVYGKRCAFIHDAIFEGTRHFLLLEAEAAGFEEITSFVRGWTYQGPGVWTDEDFDAFFNRLPLQRRFVDVVIAARGRLAQFGDFVPLEYLSANLGTDWTAPPAMQSWLAALDRLQGLFDLPAVRGEVPPDRAIVVLWAADRKRRAEIMRRDDGLFQVCLARRKDADLEYDEDARWSPADRDLILTDTLERAKELGDLEVRSMGW